MSWKDYHHNIMILLNFYLGRLFVTPCSLRKCLSMNCCFRSNTAAVVCSCSHKGRPRRGLISTTSTNLHTPEYKEINIRCRLHKYSKCLHLTQKEKPMPSAFLSCIIAHMIRNHVYPSRTLADKYQQIHDNCG